MSKKAVKVTAIVIAAIFLIGICSGIAASFLFYWHKFVLGLFILKRMIMLFLRFKNTFMIRFMNADKFCSKVL